MTGGLESRALTLLEEALEVPAAERPAWVRARCGGDQALERRVLRLLDIGTASSVRLKTGGAPSLLTEQEPPVRVGAYRITGLIGQGGMGAVYRGERVSGDFQHVVAIKLIRPGALSDTLVERFQRERQTLATLIHPHIARLYDGGETDGGQPYIVMEYIEGRPLDRWLDEVGPSESERVRLFLEVCAAVGFAHQNLIIHRDLTPSNILVEETGSAKLIDFGIARPPALGDQPAATPSRRSPAGLSLTPGFAAPERLAGAPATTLSDVYSLGVILSRMLPEHHDGDLKAIIAKATALDQADRYASADALAEDIRARRAGLPVSARERTRGYVIGRFVSRHRSAVLAGIGVLLLLVSALVVTALSYSRAEQARAAEAQRFADLRSLAGYMLFDLNDRLARVAGNTGARASLAAEAQKYLNALARSEGADRSLRLETARGLIELARVQGLPGQPTLGEPQLAKRNLLTAEQDLLALAREGGMKPDLAAALGQSRAYRASIAVHEDKDPARATRLAAAAFKVLDAVPAEARGVGWYQALRSVRRARLDFADLQSDDTEIERAASLLAADVERWPHPLRSSEDADFDRALARYYRGLTKTKRQEGDQGLADYQAALTQFRSLEKKQRGDPNLLYWTAWAGLDGFAAGAQTGNDAASAEMLAAAQAAANRLIEVEERDDSVIVLAHNIGEAWSQHLANTGRYAEAIQTQQAVVAREKRRLAALKSEPMPLTLAFSEMILGLNAKKGGDRSLACTAWRSAEARFSYIQRRGKLLEFHAGFLPGLRRNLALCGTAAPLSAFPPLQ